MEVLYLLIPLSLILLALVTWALFWAVRSGQFEDMEGPAHRILMDDDSAKLPKAAPRSQQQQGHHPHIGA
jgi:cbb3-type cytochrome oxidase maturation protein